MPDTRDKDVELMTADEFYHELKRLCARTYTPDLGVRLFRQEEMERLVEVVEEMDERASTGIHPTTEWTGGRR